MIDLSIVCPAFAATACTAVSSWLSFHSGLAWVLLALVVFCWIANTLMDTIPRLQKFKADVWIPFARKYKHGRQVKAAIKADIESRINDAILSFGDELPVGWISKIKINWVEKESREDFFDDGEMVLRMRPLDDQQRNFVRAGHAFLQKAFFPRAKNTIPLEHREASILFTGRKIMARQGEETKKLYEDDVLEPAVNKNSRVLPIMQRYEVLDNKGFFYGAFLREVHAVAVDARFNHKVRDKMREEASVLLDHIEEFINLIPKVPEPLWSRRGPITSYAFLLVAADVNVEKDNISIFVNKAQERLAGGVDRLYIFGSRRGRAFVNKVVGAIKQQVPQYELIEKFDLAADFRGEENGVGALFVRR